MAGSGVPLHRCGKCDAFWRTVQLFVICSQFHDDVCAVIATPYIPGFSPEVSMQSIKVAILLLGCVSSAASSQVSGLDREGREFRQKIEKAGASSSNDLTALCKSERFVGLTMHELERKMAAAGGQATDMNTLPPKLKKPAGIDAVGGISLSSSVIGSSAFEIGFKFTGRDGRARISEVVYCAIRSAYL
jgi:hypothetical protein